MKADAYKIILLLLTNLVNIWAFKPNSAAAFIPAKTWNGSNHVNLSYDLKQKLKIKKVYAAQIIKIEVMCFLWWKDKNFNILILFMN